MGWFAQSPDSLLLFFPSLCLSQQSYSLKRQLGFLLSDKGNVLFSLLIFPPEMPGSLPHRHYSLWFPQPFHWLLPGEKQWKISQGTSPVTSQKAIIIYLHIRAAPVIFYFKKSLFHVLLSRNAAG